MAGSAADLHPATLRFSGILTGLEAEYGDARFELSLPHVRWAMASSIALAYAAPSSRWSWR